MCCLLVIAVKTIYRISKFIHARKLKTYELNVSSCVEIGVVILKIVHNIKNRNKKRYKCNHTSLNRLFRRKQNIEYFACDKLKYTFNNYI